MQRFKTKTLKKENRNGGRAALDLLGERREETEVAVEPHMII